MMNTLTDWMIRWLARKHDSPAEAIEAFADRLGVEVWLVRDRAVEEAAEDGEVYTSRESAVVEAVADEPTAVLEGTVPYAIEEADEPIQWVGPNGEALLVQPDPIRGADREDQLEHLSDLGDRLELPPETWCVDPLKKIERLDDDPRKAYVWLLGERATGDDVDTLDRALTKRYREEFGRDPAALHMIVRDLDDIREIPGDVIEHTIKPWLKEREEAIEAEGERGGDREDAEEPEV